MPACPEAASASPTGERLELPTEAGAEPATTLDLDSLGTCRPDRATHGSDPASRPFACAVRITVRGLSVDEAVEQGEAIAMEVAHSLHERGAVRTSNRQLMHGAQHYVMWENLGATHSIRLQPNKSNSVVWLSRAWCERSELDPMCSWSRQRELIARHLPHASAWIQVLERAREDGGIDIKDDCRLENRSAKCHQDGNNWMKKEAMPLLRLAINTSSRQSGRSLEYLEMASNERFVDGEERNALLVASISQHAMWHGAAQTTAAYVKGLAEVCHGSSAGSGPCLKRIITVFSLPPEHPLAKLSACQRLRRIGIEVHAVEPRHQLGRRMAEGQAVELC